MECRLCLCSAPPESFIFIHDDTRLPQLVQRIWICCRLRVSYNFVSHYFIRLRDRYYFSKLQVRKDDELPDMICHSCVNNLELLDSFRNACLRTDETSRLKSDKSLGVKTEEALLEDLIWEDETCTNFPPSYGEVSE